jgi:glutamine---fructose-6-phosphate transaminase (isomerizing)
MCGIVAVRSRDHAERYLLPALRRLEYRGYDSVGIAVATLDGGTAVLRTVDRIDRLAQLVEERTGAELSGVGIGHTRWATHGRVTERNAHPHRDCAGRISVVHNGIIDDADALRARLQAEGHEFASEVDSEVVAHAIEAELAEGRDLVVAVERAVAELHGSWALVVLDATSGRMVATATRSPLVLAQSAHGDFVASDIAAIVTWVDAYRVLGDGDVVELGAETVWRRDGAPVPPPAEVPARWHSQDIAMDGHADYMAKEIDEQPEVAAAVLDGLLPRVADGRLWRDLGLPAFRRVVMVGCGTSLNAGAAVGTAFGGLGGVPHRAAIASETDGTLIEPGTLVLAFSQSGETADVLRAVERIDVGPASGSALLAVTNNVHSSLARMAGAVVDCSAGPEIGVAASKTFVAQVITGVCVALSSLVASGRMDRARAVVLADELRRLPDLLAQSLAVSRLVVPPLVPELRDASGFVFLGRGAGAVYAAEGALKLKELSYRWAEAFPAGELKHGPLALVESGTPVVVVDDGDPRLEANIAEVTARGARVIRVGGSGATIPALGLSVAAPVRGGMDRWGPLESVIPLQVLARELALALGRDVDKPRNLAKSVTVE